jgi:regulator of nucleoside diphosphate kinase
MTGVDRRPAITTGERLSMNPYVDSSMPDWTSLRDHPPVHVTVGDRRRLHALLSSGCILDTVTARFLATELERAIVCPAEAIPPDVVTLNSRVVFRTDAAPGMESRVLVHPEDYVPTGQHVPVTAPLGIALFGLRAGATLIYPTLDGRTLGVRVERVAYQPETAARC